MKKLTILLLIAVFASTLNLVAGERKGKGKRKHAIKKEMKQHRWKKFDKDGDGELSKEERKAFREAMKKQRRLKKFDKDGDGKISEKEAKAEKAYHYKKMLEKFDKDGDGKLSPEERETAKKYRKIKNKNKKENNDKVTEVLAVPQPPKE